MAEKKATPARKTAVKGEAKAAAKRRVSKGESLECEVCGLSVVVEEVGGIAVREESTLLCCGKPMKQRKTKAKAAK